MRKPDILRTKSIRNTIPVLGVSLALVGCGQGDKASEAPYAPINKSLETQLEQAPTNPARLKLLAEAGCVIVKGMYTSDQAELSKTGEHLTEDQTSAFLAPLNGINGRYNEIQYGQAEPPFKGFDESPKYPEMESSLTGLQDRYCREYNPRG